MAQMNELYVSFQPDEYRIGKSQNLQAQADILNSIKHLKNIKEIREQQALYKTKLYEIFSKILEHIEKLEDKIPTPKVPKSISEKMEVSETKKFKVPTKHDDIDEELMEIKEKLRELTNA